MSSSSVCTAGEAADESEQVGRGNAGERFRFRFAVHVIGPACLTFAFAGTALKNTLKLACAVGLLLVVAVAMMYLLHGDPRSLRLRREFDNLVRTNNHEAVARAAIARIRTINYREFMADVYVTNLPPVIAQMRPQSVATSPEGMKIEFCGGSDPIGFEVRAREEFWEMSWYAEHRSHSLLRIRMDQSSGESDGAANESQPIRSGTNRTSSAAGSRR